MGGYYLNKREAPLKDYSAGSTSPGTMPPIQKFTPRYETCMSYRTRGNGQLIPDFQADPYAYFLRTSFENKRKKAEAKYLPKKPFSAVPSAPSLVIDGLPLTVEGSVKNNPVKDNGHAFYTHSQHVSTDRWSGPYTYINKGTNGTSTQLFPIGLFAQGATVDAAHAGRMPFQFSGSTISARRIFKDIPDSSAVDGRYYGSKAIGEVAPNRPEVNLAAILGELREGLPSIPGMLLLKSRAESIKGSVKKLGKASGSEYLNIQFGLIPLLSDITAVIKALEKASERLSQYERDAGKGVRRTMSFPVTKKKETFSGSELSAQGTIIGTPPQLFVKGSVGGSLYGSSWKSILTMRYTQRVWFKGSFTYFVPQGTDLASNIDKYRHEAARYFGATMTLETLWQLSPWSWLIDWLTDLNTSISAYQRLSDDSLVVNYGYVMATTSKVATQETTVVPSTVTKQTFDVMSCRTSITSVRKERVRANPYGFTATTPDALSGKQWSILAALGLSRM